MTLFPRRHFFGLGIHVDRSFAAFLLLARFLFLPAFSSALHAANYPAPAEGDFVARDFRFASGETLSELRVHYRTLGKPVKNDKGIVRNAVLIMHGTTGSGAQFIRPEFAGQLSEKISRSMRRSSSSYCRMALDTASRASRAMDCTRSFRATAIATWWKRSSVC
jgi:hypothetical protein